MSTNRPEAGPEAKRAPGGRSDERAPGGLRAAVESFVARQTGSPASVVALWELPAGTMRHACALDVEISSGELAGRHRLIYLADRGGTPLPSHLGREREFRVLSVMHAAGVRVPKPYWHVQPGDPSGIGSGLIVERVAGEALARRLTRDLAFERVRPRLLGQMGEELARIHAVPIGPLGRLPGPPPGQSAAEFQLGELARALDGLGEPHPALELGLRWLHGRTLRGERLVAVHGDYRLGNFLADPEQGLAAVLDWDLCHVGDPGEDLGWVCMRFWRCVDRAGAPGLGPRERFLDAYAAVSGWRLDAEGELFWEVFANVRWAVITLTQAHRHLSGQEESLELASIGRHCAEVEWELLRLLGCR